MAELLRVILEVGKKRMVVAGAMDWPGLDGRGRRRPKRSTSCRPISPGMPASRTWPIQFLVRRTAHHGLDHAWELEDRDPVS